MSDPFRVAPVVITLDDGTTMQLKACVYAYNHSGEILPLEEKKWSAWKFMESESFKQTEQVMAEEERVLEHGSQKEQTALADCVREMGFRESPSQLPKSLIMALSNRFTYNQVLQRDSNSDYFGPVFSSGSSMFPAFTVSRSPGATLEAVAKLMTPAILRGYNRHTVRGRNWQALYPSDHPMDQVTGTIYFGIHDIHKDFYDHKKATAEIELADGTKMDLQVNAFVWKGKREELVPISEATWSPSTMLNSTFYKMIAAASEAAEDRLAFDQVFRNFQKLDTLGKVQSSSELSRY